MPQYTDRLKLIKPLSGEGPDAGRGQYNSNFDTLDRMPGITICTSSTRPANPFDGQVAYETNTDEIIVYNGSKWEYSSNAPWRGKSPLFGTFDTAHRVRHIGGNQVLSPNANQVYTLPLPSDMQCVLSVSIASGDETNGHYYVFINSNPIIASGIRFAAFNKAQSGRLSVPVRVWWDAAITYT